MNLSTFSFRAELKAIALALALLLAVEAGMRWLEPHLSVDVSHIQEIPQIVDRLARAQGEHLLFLGNSTTRRGVDMDVLEPALAEQGVAADDLSVGLVHPDASDILDWLYVYQHNFGAFTAQPDVMVVSFATDNLQDVSPNPQQIRRVARHHTSVQDIPKVFSQDFTTLSQRGDYLFSKVFASFAHRERVRVRLLAMMIPYYKQTEQGLNETQLVSQTLPTKTPQIRYTRLERFLSEVDTAAVRVIFVAMPLRDPYQLDPELRGILERQGAELINLQSVPGITPDAFLDGLHLTPEGAVVYSRALAQKLAPFLKLELYSELPSGR